MSGIENAPGFDSLTPHDQQVVREYAETLRRGPRQPLDDMRREIEQDRKEIARLRIIVAQLTRYVQKHRLATRDDAELAAILAEAEKTGE